MNTNQILNKVRVLLGMEVKLETMKLGDGVTVLEAEMFEAGNEVFVVTEDEQKIALPIGEYEMEDSRILVVVESFFSEIEALKTENETLKAELSKLKETKEVELSEVKPISFNPENENTNESIKLGAKRTRTTMDSILEKLNK